MGAQNDINERGGGGEMWSWSLDVYFKICKSVDAPGALPNLKLSGFGQHNLR